MKIFSHNLDAGKKAYDMLEKSSKACVIHATGTGKSYISRYLMERYRKKRIGYFAPSEYILNQMKTMLIESNYDMTNVVMMTYVSLANSIIRDEINMEFDLIILDEFHRCGAKYWGEGVAKLLEINKKAKIFGTTATPIRTLDNSRDMSDELFEGNIASILTMSDAIEQGILQTPKYVVALYSYIEELNNLRERVSKIKDDVKRISINEKVTKLVERLQNAKGLSEIFADNITDKKSKCIVFAKSVEHLEAIKEELVEKLKIVNNDIHVYVVHSKNSNSEKEFEEFKADNSDALKLLLTIDMFNEGMHIEDVKVAILLRPTKSFIVYNQQIGRVLETSCKEQPIILDLVNNFDDMTMVKSFKEERSCYIEREKEISEDTDEFTFPFEVIDEVREIKELFTELYQEITISKEEKVQLLVEFYKEYEREPKCKEEYKGIKLGRFINSIRIGNTKISEEDSELLKKTGYRLEIINKQEEVHKKVQLLVEFYKENGREPKNREEYKGVKLGNFLTSIRMCHTNITEEDRELLDKVGCRINFQNKKEEIHKKVQLLVEFYIEYGREPKAKEVYKDVKIGSFWGQINRGVTKITQENRQLLDKVGYKFKNRKEEIQRKVQLLIEFYNKYEREPKTREQYNGARLGNFLQSIRQGDSKLSTEDIELLKETGYRLEPLNIQEEIHKKVQLLIEFYNKYGRDPKQKEEYNGAKLGLFLKTIRRESPNITEEDRELLKKTGIRTTKN